MGAAGNRVFGLMVVRNVADLIEINVRHHLELGVERLLVVDNGSDDGTSECLERLEPELALEVDRDDGPFAQAEIVNRIAARAREMGADWLLPIDADEFFSCPTPISVALASASASAVSVEVINFVQRYRRRRPSPRGLLSMDHRPAKTIPQGEARYHVEAGEWSIVEVAWHPKLIVRAQATEWIEAGAHEARGDLGKPEPADGIVCLHAPLRARSEVEGRIEHAGRLRAAGMAEEVGWQSRSFLYATESIEQAWRANSNSRGTLVVGGERRALIRDTRLRDLAARHAPSRLRALAGMPHTR